MAENEKKIKVRQLQKIDTSTNWEKAKDSFIPLKGEIVIYSDLQKFKVGDGVSTIGALDFMNGNTDNLPGLKTSEGGEIFNDYEVNVANKLSHAEGLKTRATGSAAHTEGHDTLAEANCAHAEGHASKALGYASHAEGRTTETRGHSSHATGSGTFASGAQTFVSGTYNIIDMQSNNLDAEGKHLDLPLEQDGLPKYQYFDDVQNYYEEKGRYAHIVGNGTPPRNGLPAQRSNAYTLDWRGNGWFAGDVYVGGSSQDNAKKLATEEYVKNNSSVSDNIEAETLLIKGDNSTATLEDDDGTIAQVHGKLKVEDLQVFEQAIITDISAGSAEIQALKIKNDNSELYDVNEAIVDINEKIENINLSNPANLPLTSDIEKKNLIINEGVADGDYSIAGGTTDQTLINGVLGEDLGGQLTGINPSEANATMSISYGSSNIAHSSASSALGIKNQAGFLGYYIFAISSDKKTLTLSKTQNRETASKPTANILSQWKAGYDVSIINEYLYPYCAKVASVNTSAGTVTFDRELPFNSIYFPTKEVSGISIDIPETPHDRSIIAIPPVERQEYKIDLPILGETGTGEYFDTFRPGAIGEVELGFSSAAFGFDNIAAGTLSTAIGYRNTAIGTASFVSGRENTGSFASLVGGYKNEGTGSAVSVSGTCNKAIGDYSHAEGKWTIANGEGSHAEGRGNADLANTATGAGAHVEGRATQANGSGAHAEGVLTKSLAEGSHAEGKNTTALGAQSHIEGFSKTAADFDNETDISTIIDIHTQSADEEKFSCAYGNYSHVEGSNSLALGISAHAEGNRTISDGNYSHAEGRSSRASGMGAHSEGKETTASGENSHAEGNKTWAIGTDSHAEGNNALAGCKGFYIAAIDPANNHIYLHTGENAVIPTWDNPSNNYVPEFNTDYVLYTEEELVDNSYGNEFSVSSNGYYHWPFAGNITEISGNRITYESDILNTTDKWLSNVIDPTTGEPGADPMIFFIPVQSDKGLTNMGLGSHAEGWNTFAGASHTHSEGYYTVAAGRYGHAEGYGSRAGYAAHAEGHNTLASGLNSHAEGSITKATDDNSHAEGRETIASGYAAHAEGQYTEASGTHSHAEGFGNEDNYTVASGVASHAEGRMTKALGHSSHAEGRGTAAKGGTDWDKGATHAEGLYTCAEGIASHSEGYRTNALGNHSHAEGESTGQGVPATTDIHEVYENWKQYYGKSFSMALGVASHAEGSDSLALGPFAHAEGKRTVALGEQSHSEGWNTEVLGNYAHAEGASTKATAECSHAEGYNTSASGTYSHAEGHTTEASGTRAHAEGWGTIANGCWQHAEGKWNIKDTDVDIANKKYGKYVHIVGNGTGENVYGDDGVLITQKRSNAHTLDWDGNAWFAGNVYVGNTNQDDGNRLIEERYVLPQKTITNLVLEENIIYGKLYQRATNTWNTNVNWDTVKVSCKPGETFYSFYDNNAHTANEITVTYLNANDKWVTGKFENVKVPGFFTVPDDENIVAFYYCIKHEFKDKLAIYKTNETTKLVIPYGKTVVLKDKITKWDGKKWYAYGTSITEVDNSTVTGKYAPYLADLSGMTLINKGIGSQGIANADLGGYSSNTGAVKDALMSDDGKAEADLITIEVGANDFGVVSAGNLGNYYDIGDDTFCGRLNQCLAYLQENTNAQILVIGSPYGADTGAKDKYELFKATEECCRYNGIQYLYSNNNLGFAKLTATNDKYLRRDHTVIHQSELGGYVYAQHVWEKLKTMPLFY